METKKSRILFLYDLFLEGKEVNARSVAQDFQVSIRTIQRDIAEIRVYLSEVTSRKGGYQEIVYNEEKRVYILKVKL